MLLKSCFYCFLEKKSHIAFTFFAKFEFGFFWFLRVICDLFYWSFLLGKDFLFKIHIPFKHLSWLISKLLSFLF